MAKEIHLSKRSQAERIALVGVVAETIWLEFQDGDIDDDILQTAVNAQVCLNRIVWLLNERLNEDEEVRK